MLLSCTVHLKRCVTNFMHNRMIVGTLMNSVCSGKSPCRCSWFGLKDIVTLLALKVTTENSELRAKPGDSTSLEQCCSAACMEAAKEQKNLQHSPPC